MTPNRLYGFDLIRLVSMTAIVLFHSNETAFFADRSPLDWNQSLYLWVEAYSRHLVFSGFTVIALTCFLYGSRPRAERSWLSLFGLILAGIFVLAWVEGEQGFFTYHFEWDVYPFLLVSLFSLFLARKSLHAIAALGLIGFCLLWVPVWDFWKAPSGDPGLWYEALIGYCGPAGPMAGSGVNPQSSLGLWSSAVATSPVGAMAVTTSATTVSAIGGAGTGAAVGAAVGVGTGGGGWPLFPWIGLLWMFFALGTFWGKVAGWRERTRRLGQTELAIWTLALVASVPLLGGYSEVPVGPGFGCFTFRRPPLIFWSHFIWVVFLMRLSLVVLVNKWLGDRSWARFVSSLHWSRHFGLCYLLHLAVLGFGSLAADLFLQHPRLFDVYLLGTMPATEGLSRLLVAARSRVVN